MIELSLVIPTFNERDNIIPLIDRIHSVLHTISYEIIFVDDNSPDGTAEHVRTLAQKNLQIRCLQRVGRRGLSPSCIEGTLSSTAPFIVIMDADMQHDESILPLMLKTLQEDDCDLVVGSRYTEGGASEGLSFLRKAISQTATALAQRLLKVPLTDPMSGFFMFKRSFFKKALPHLSGKGFKILLDMTASCPEKYSFREIPYEFRSRVAGESKLGSTVMLEYLFLLLDKTVGRIIPLRFVLFVAMGMGGLTVHVTILWILYRYYSFSFVLAQTAAVCIAMIVNYTLNNQLTYRDKRLKGWNFFRGLGSFCLLCSIGAVINIFIARTLYRLDIFWALAGLLGAITGAIWNYVATALFTWPTKEETFTSTLS